MFYPKVKSELDHCTTILNMQMAMARSYIKIELCPTTYSNLPGKPTFIYSKQPRKPVCYQFSLARSQIVIFRDNPGN